MSWTLKVGGKSYGFVDVRKGRSLNGPPTHQETQLWIGDNGVGVMPARASVCALALIVTPVLIAALLVLIRRRVSKNGRHT